MQANEQVERFSATIKSRLRHCVAKHEMDCETFLFLLAYVYNVQFHQTTKLHPFSQAPTRLSPGTTTITRPVLPDVNENDSTFAYRLLLNYRAEQVRKKVDKDSKKALVRYNKVYGSMYDSSHTLQRMTTFSSNAPHENSLTINTGRECSSTLVFGGLHISFAIVSTE